MSVRCVIGRGVRGVVGIGVLLGGALMPLGVQAIVGAPASAAVALVNSRLVYSHYRGSENPQIWVMNADGSSKIRLTQPTGAGENFAPAWSPNGARIVYQRAASGADGIWVMRADGSGRKRLTGPAGAEPAWSPLGTTIAYVHWGRNGGGSIWVMRADGSDQKPLTPARSDDRDPTWSPDGTKIAYTTSDDRIGVMNADGTGKKVLLPAAIPGDHPAWSPDGTKIAYMQWDAGTTHIAVMNANGSNVHALTSTGGNYDPTWSPDGRKISYAHRDSDTSERLIVMNADGSNKKTLVFRGVNDHPSWLRKT